MHSDLCSFIRFTITCRNKKKLTETHTSGEIEQSGLHNHFSIKKLCNNRALGGTAVTLICPSPDRRSAQCYSRPQTSVFFRSMPYRAALFYAAALQPASRVCIWQPFAVGSRRTLVRRRRLPVQSVETDTIAGRWPRPPGQPGPRSSGPGQPRPLPSGMGAGRRSVTRSLGPW